MSQGEFGPMPADHTNVGGMPSENNPDQDSMQPVEQHSPTKVRVPGLREVILGGSGGIRVRGIYAE